MVCPHEHGYSLAVRHAREGELVTLASLVLAPTACGGRTDVGAKVSSTNRDGGIQLPVDGGTQNESGSCGCSGSPAICGAQLSLVTLASGQNHPVAVALDAANVYWTTRDAIMKAPLGGGTATVLASGQNQPAGIAVDGMSVYWTTSVGAGAVVTVPIGGGTPTSLASSKNQLAGIAADDTSVYWTDMGSLAAQKTDGLVMKLPLGGGIPVTLASGQSAPAAIAVDATSVYWANSANPGTVMTVPISGGTPATLAAGQNLTLALTLDATTVYWMTYGGTGSLMSVAKGGGPVTALVSRQGSASEFPSQGIAVDCAGVYWTEWGKVMRVPSEGGTPAPLASGHDPQGLAVNAAGVYWANGGTNAGLVIADGTGSVMKLTTP